MRRPTGRSRLDIMTYVNPQANTALQGIYLSRGVYCSQCEAQGFRRITFFIDRPDVLSVYTVRLEADVKAAPVLLANGNPIERGTLAAASATTPSGMTRTPSRRYLFAIVGGDLAPVSSTFKTMSGRKIDLQDLRRTRQRAAALTGPWIALKRSMTWDEETLWPRIRSRRVQYRRRVRFQHGSDGEQGPQHL